MGRPRVAGMTDGGPDDPSSSLRVTAAPRRIRAAAGQEATGSTAPARLRAMSKPTSNADLPVRRIDRILAFMSLGLIVLSIVCFFAVIIGSATGAAMATGIWPTIGVIVWIAPPLAFVLMMTVLIMSFVRRARANRAG